MGPPLGPHAVAAWLSALALILSGCASQDEPAVATSEGEGQQANAPGKSRGSALLNGTDLERGQLASMISLANCTGLHAVAQAQPGVPGFPFPSPEGMPRAIFQGAEVRLSMIACDRALVDGEFLDSNVALAWTSHSNLSAPSQPEFDGRFDMLHVPLQAFTSSGPLAATLDRAFPEIHLADLRLIVPGFDNGHRTTMAAIEWPNGSINVESLETDAQGQVDRTVIARLLLAEGPLAWYSIYEGGATRGDPWNAEVAGTGDSSFALLYETMPLAEVATFAVTLDQADWTFILNGDGSWTP